MGAPRIVGIIQARMGSRRFPGKMLADLAGRPLIWHVMTRMRRASVLDQLMLATSTERGDDVLAAYAATQGLPVYRGPEDDVLARFQGAAAASAADIIVRVNGDAPLVDPVLTDRLVTALIADDADYVATPADVACFHDGVDPMSRRILERLGHEVSGDPLAREHVTGYFKAHPAFGRRALVEIEPALQVQGPRLSVDTPDDLAFFTALYRRFGAPAGALDLRHVAWLYRANTLARPRSALAS